MDFAKRLLPNAEAALRWIDEYGDRDGDGFVEYETRSPGGIRNQGWKDSHDVDRARRRPPRRDADRAERGAGVRVPREAADGRRVLDARATSSAREFLRAQAHELRGRFNDAFWMEDEQFFAGALDRDKRQVRTVMSNPGHALYCDIVDPEKARARREAAARTRHVQRLGHPHHEQGRRRVQPHELPQRIGVAPRQRA